MDDHAIERVVEAAINAIRLEAWSTVYDNPKKLMEFEMVYPKMLPPEWGTWAWHIAITQTVIQLRTTCDVIPDRNTFEVVLARIIVGCGLEIGKSKEGGTILAIIKSLQEADPE
jgi:hypothetical protein